MVQLAATRTGAATVTPRADGLTPRADALAMSRTGTATSNAVPHGTLRVDRHTPTAGEDVDRLGDEIATLAAHLHAATYQLLVLLAEFDERGGWGGGGFRSCAHWLSWRTGIAAGAAREKVRTARALRTLPHVGGAMRAGELSFAKVRAITRVMAARQHSPTWYCYVGVTIAPSTRKGCASNELVRPASGSITRTVTSSRVCLRLRC